MGILSKGSTFCNSFILKKGQVGLILRVDHFRKLLLYNHHSMKTGYDINIVDMSCGRYSQCRIKSEDSYLLKTFSPSDAMQTKKKINIASK